MSKLVVGFTGHRPNRLPPAEWPRIARQLEAVLLALQSNRPAADLTLVSGLAEGSDQTAAHVALDLGWSLEALLPFSRRRYLDDFATPEAKRAFEELRARCGTVIEAAVADAFPDMNDAYATQGAALVERCDVLVTVWDGQAAHGRGGTSENVAAARAKGACVYWISTAPAAEVTFLTPDPPRPGGSRVAEAIARLSAAIGKPR